MPIAKSMKGTEKTCMATCSSENVENILSKYVTKKEMNAGG